jgi:hypothetical protein
VPAIRALRGINVENLMSIIQYKTSIFCFHFCIYFVFIIKKSFGQPLASHRLVSCAIRVNPKSLVRCNDLFYKATNYSTITKIFSFYRADADKSFFLRNILTA